MLGNELIKNFLKYVHQLYAVNITDFDIQLDGGFWDTDQAIDQLSASNIISNDQVIDSILQLFKESRIGSDFMTNVFTPSIKIELINFNTKQFEKRNRAFSFSDIQFGYLAFKKLYENVPLSSIDTSSEDFKTLVDFVGTALILAQNNKISKLFNLITASNDNYGILVHKVAHTFKSLSIYSYIYYSELLKGGTVKLDSVLEYNLPHGATVVFNGNVKYQQYFEVFDIINELNHAKDIILRFIKLYHILEYLVYRVELVDIEEKARVNRTFIREIHSLTGKTQSEKEFGIFKKNFGEIFRSEVRSGKFNLGTLNAAERKFLKNHWDVNSFSHTNPDMISKLIYRIRNSIVHNKESEFHITTTNPDDYAIIIPIIKKLIQVTEKEVFTKISNDDTTISYQSQTIALY